MIRVSLFIVINIQEDSEGYLCPCFFTLEDLKKEYPNDEYVEVQMDELDINLN